MDACTHEIRNARWKKIIEQCQNRPKGQTTKQWLAENQVSEKSYYYWLRKTRKIVYDQLSDSSTLPLVQEKSEITFAEMPIPPQISSDYSASFQPAAVIKTNTVTVALSNSISDELLTRILREVSHA